MQFISSRTFDILIARPFVIEIHFLKLSNHSFYTKALSCLSNQWIELRPKASLMISASVMEINSLNFFLMKWVGKTTIRSISDLDISTKSGVVRET